MTDSEYQALCSEAVTALRAVMRVDAAKIRDTVKRTHSVGAIIDPTAYRDAMGSLDDQAALARAIRAAQSVVLENDRLRMMFSVADLQEGRELWPCLAGVSGD